MGKKQHCEQADELSAQQTKGMKANLGSYVVRTWSKAYVMSSNDSNDKNDKIGRGDCLFSCSWLWYVLGTIRVQKLYRKQLTYDKSAECAAWVVRREALGLWCPVWPRRRAKRWGMGRVTWRRRAASGGCSWRTSSERSRCANQWLFGGLVERFVPAIAQVWRG